MHKASSRQTSYVPTSSVVRDLLDEAPRVAVTIGWIMERLEERSFGLVMLLLALLASLPVLSLLAGPLVIWIAAEMILARPRPTLPRFVTRRAISTPRFAMLIARLVPVLRWLERFVRPRWPTPFAPTRRVLGVILLLLGVSLLNPVPFSHLIPAGVIMGVALAYLEKDGVMLALALAAALTSLVASAATIWAAVYSLRVFILEVLEAS